ncbi:hypothetical protein CTA2_4568 [Colletotrichum tanaceti]|uniref:Uncharacterized protein n=1 Tax=Colletotrichum tanaceti TaxID=1306861 RepID=A0A4U6XLN9_9PEZI|nr:hypothetical protein CTA2_4568 [Colletotrichum tanaceti]TKW56555.1 hypothetical protein CTA1_9405 [Colletotrichum tanaceti]
MSEPEPEPDRTKRLGVSHGTSAPLSDALRGALNAAIEAIYAIGGPDAFLHCNAPSSDGRHASTTSPDAVLTTSFPAPHPPLDAAFARLTECLKRWESRIEHRSLRCQTAVYHFHPPWSFADYESRVTGQNMSDADSTLVARLRWICPKLGFEVFPVVLKYSGNTCQYNVWVPLEQRSGHTMPGFAEHNGFWKAYQHVKHTPSFFQFNTFSGATLAENAACHERNLLDEKNVFWERSRRGIFGWRSPDEQRLYEEERKIREANPQWYQNITPGTSRDLGYYYAPAVIIVPFSTQMDFVNRAGNPQPVARVWRYLLAQCNESVKSGAYFAAVQTLCNFLWPENDDAPTETQILGLRIRDRQEWIDAVDSGIMGELIVASLVTKDSHLFTRLIARTQVEPKVNYTWVCEKASVHGYAAAEVLYGLRRFLFKRSNFLQIAGIVDRLPAYCEASDTAETVLELVKATLSTLESPVSASHGRIVVNFIRLFKDFKTWSDVVQPVIASEQRQLHRHSQFMLGLLNRLVEVTRKDSLPIDQVTAFYQQYADPKKPSQTVWQVRRLVSNATKVQTAEAKTARQTWFVAEPNEEFVNERSESLSTHHSVIAGIFRSLDRLGMHDQVTDLADYIVGHIAEVESIHISPLWMPLLMVLQDLADPGNRAFRRLFQAIFEHYDKAVFEDISGRLEHDPDSIPHMAECCKYCQSLNSYLEQPLWKTLHLVHPRATVNHIETQLCGQGKPVKIVVYGKNEASLTMQLTKTSLVNEKLRQVVKLRRQEATTTVRQFDPVKLLPFLEDKGEIMWRLGNAESAEAPKDISARRSDSQATSSTAKLSISSSSSTPDVSPSPSEAHREHVQQLGIKSETPSSIKTRLDKSTPRVESPSGFVTVKAEPSSAAGSARRSVHGDIRALFGAASIKQETTSVSSQSLPKANGSSTRDRLRELGNVKLESTPKYDDGSTQRLRAVLAKSRAQRQAPGSSGSIPSNSLSETSTPSERTESLASSAASTRSRNGSHGLRTTVGLRDGTPLSPLVQSATAGSGRSRPSVLVGSLAGSTPPLGSLAGTSRRNLGVGVRDRSPSSSPSRATGSIEPDFMAAILDAERARKRRAGSTWEVRAASGNVVGSGTSSKKSRLESCRQVKENSRLPSLTGAPCLGTGLAGRARSTAGALVARSPNARPGTTRIPASAGGKRKITSDDDAIIDLGGDSPPSGGANKKKKSIPVFNLLDDDPFGED